MVRSRKIAAPPQDPTGASMARGQSKQDYGTPANFITAVEKRFGPIAFDLAAEEHNHKASAPDPRNVETSTRGVPFAPYFSPEQDSFRQVWRAKCGTLWLNPPFNNIAPWAEKCAWESSPEHGPRFDRILLLVPASVGSEWFARYVFDKAKVYLLTGRLSFDGKAPYPKDCILCSYPGLGFELWRWAASF